MNNAATPPRRQPNLSRRGQVRLGLAAFAQVLAGQALGAPSTTTVQSETPAVGLQSVLNRLRAEYLATINPGTGATPLKV